MSAGKTNLYPQTALTRALPATQKIEPPMDTDEHGYKKMILKEVFSSPFSIRVNPCSSVVQIFADVFLFFIAVPDG